MPTQDAKLCVLVIRVIHGDETKNLSANNIKATLKKSPAKRPEALTVYETNDPRNGRRSRRWIRTVSSPHQTRCIPTNHE